MTAVTRSFEPQELQELPSCAQAAQSVASSPRGKSLEYAFTRMLEEATSDIRKWSNESARLERLAASP